MNMSSNSTRMKITVWQALDMVPIYSSEWHISWTNAMVATFNFVAVTSCRRFSCKYSILLFIIQCLEILLWAQLSVESLSDNSNITFVIYHQNNLVKLNLHHKYLVIIYVSPNMTKKFTILFYWQILYIPHFHGNKFEIFHIQFYTRINYAWWSTSILVTDDKSSWSNFCQNNAENF